MIERYIALAGRDAPPDHRQPVRFDPPEIDGLDLDAAGITTVLWTTGYRPDFGWIDRRSWTSRAFRSSVAA
jgi:putative flavoprotein involved in K+ transport